MRIRDWIAGIGIAAAVTVLTAIPAMDELHGPDTDFLHWLNAVIPGDSNHPPSEVAVIAIDEETYRTAPFRGLPKAMWTPQIATVQDAVLAAGASVFAWDVILPTSANTYLTDKRYDKDLLQSLAIHGRREGRVILGEASLGEQPLRPFPFFIRAAGGFDNMRSLNAYVDPDGIVRGVPLFLDYKGNPAPIPSMAMEIARRHAGVDPEIDAEGDIRFGEARIPTQGAENLILSFPTRPGAVPTYSLADIHSCIEAGKTDYLKQAFAGKAVLFGLVLDLEDRKLASNRLVNHRDFLGAPTKCDGSVPAVAPVTRRSVPGVYIHATAVNNILHGTAIDRPGFALALAAPFLVSVAGAGLALRFRPAHAACLLAAGLVVYLALATILFRNGHQLPLTDPLAGAALALAAGIGYRFVTADKEKERVRKSFSHYLDPKVIDAMLDRGEIPALGGENRTLTCFFSDIAGFSTISEKMSPERLVGFLNEYFKVMGEAIQQHGGIIERFEGDAICAVFGAPVPDADHARHAVACALAIHDGLNAAQSRFDIPDGKTVETRIGVNTGEMTVGNVGAENRYHYTVMGDAVNLAARLETAGKQFGTLLLVGEETVKVCEDHFVWREIDRVRVVGRNAPVTIYEPLGGVGTVTTETLDRKARYENALKHFRACEFINAEAIFKSLADMGDAAAAKALERTRARIADPPPTDWDGVTDLSSK